MKIFILVLSSWNSFDVLSLMSSLFFELISCVDIVIVLWTDFLLCDTQNVTSKLIIRELRLWNRLKSSNNNKVLLRDKKRYQKYEKRKNCYLVTI